MYLIHSIRAFVHRVHPTNRRKRIFYICLFLCLPTFITLGSWLEITFVGKNVSFQVPAEITFALDLSGVNSENIYIKKSKDDLNGVRVSKSQKEFKATYAFPGYYKAQLIADNELLKVNDVFVKSFGWVATLNKSGTIEYLNKSDIKCDAMIGLSADKLKEIESQITAPTLTFHYFDQINPVSGLDFTLETRLRSTFNSYGAPCKRIKLEIVGTNSTFLIPLSISACSVEGPILIAGQEFYPTQVDIRSLQTDYSQWQKVKMEVNGGLAKFYIADKHKLTLPVRASIGQIVGFRYHFEGAGEVDFVKLTDTREVIYAAPF